MRCPDRVPRRWQAARVVEGAEEDVDLVVARLAPEQRRPTVAAELPDRALGRPEGGRLARVEAELLAAARSEGRHGGPALTLALGAVTDVRARRGARHAEADGAAQTAAGVDVGHAESV